MSKSWIKPWNKPIRLSTFEQMKRIKEYDRIYSDNNRHYGVTCWMVGTRTYPWSPWVQIHLGYFVIQIKWYLVVLFLMVLSFMAGRYF